MKSTGSLVKKLSKGLSLSFEIVTEAGANISAVAKYKPCGYAWHARMGIWPGRVAVLTRWKSRRLPQVNISFYIGGTLVQKYQDAV